MDGGLIMILCVGFFFGSMVLILAMGIRWRELEENGEEAGGEAERPVVRVPQVSGTRFFGSVQPHPLIAASAAGTGATTVGDFEEQLENYIQCEQETVAEFAASPSVEDLFRPSEFVGFDTTGHGR